MLSVEKKPKISLLRSIAAVSALCAVAILGSTARANVYPSGLLVDTSAAGNNCGTVKLTYFLNEDANGTTTLPGVTIEVLDGSSVAVRTVTFASQKKGLRTWEWDGRDGSGARVSNASYSFRVTAADFGHPTWTLISSDSNTFMQFERPNGISINRVIDPVTRVASQYYGRIYVSNPRTSPTASGRTMGDGIYVLNPDQTDALGQGNTALTGGIDWSALTTTNGPYRLKVGPDENLYIGDLSDGPTGTGDLSGSGVYRVDPNVSAGSGINVLNNAGRNATTGLNTIHGSILSTPVLTGTLAGGNLKLWTMDADLSTFNSLWVYNIGGGPLPWNTAGTKLSSLGITSVSGVGRDLDIGPDGKFYIAQYRSNGAETGLYVTATDGATVLFDSLTATRTLLGNPSAVDLLRQSKSVVVTADGSKCYILMDTGNIRVLPLVAGIPQLAQLTTLTAFNAGTLSGAQISLDGAGNAYIISNITERARIYSPPDGPNSSVTATTTFSLSKSGTGGPSISVQPANQSFCVNGSVAISVTATGSNLTYQWKKNGINLTDGPDVTGSQAATLSLTNVPATDNGSTLTVLVCDDNGVVLSNPAALNIGVRFLQAPANFLVCQGGDATFSVIAAGKGSLSYQWQKDTAGNNIFVDIPSANSSSVTLTGLQVADNNSKVQVVVTDDCGSVTSSTAILTVSSGPNIGGLSGNKTAAKGSAATYSVSATGQGTLHYQWKKTVNSVVTNVGTDTPFLNLTDVQCTDNGAVISCEVTDTCGTKSANVGNLTVTPIAEVCTNGGDDDCDGLADCADTDCDGDSNCAPVCNQPFADADNDGDVDMDDFGIFQRCYGIAQVNGQLPSQCRCFDRDGDKDVDDLDFLKFKDCSTRAAVQAPDNCDDYPTGTVVINEVAYDMVTGTGAETTPDTVEFVELYNPSAVAVDISGWLLRAADTTPGTDDNRDVLIPGFPGSGTTVIASHAYYVIGGSAVPGVNLTPVPATDLWENDNESLELLDGNRAVVDTVIYELNKGAITGVSPAEGGIWGNNSVVSTTNQTLSRWVDGLDTNNNGRDFGLRPSTPGTSNQGTALVVASYVPPNVDTDGAGAVVAGLTGSFVGGLVITPGVDTTLLGTNKINPNIIPASPQGGNAIIAWDPSGGGNMVASNDIMQVNGGFDLWVYLDTSPITIAGAESTSYGIMGTTDTVYNFPDPTGNLFPATAIGANGNTGLAWVFQKDNANDHRRLVLVDAGPGGDSNLFGGITWTVVQTIDMTSVASGWYRLSINYTGATGAVTARFDTQTFNFNTATNLTGGFYIGYRETLAGQPVSLRPPTFDLRP